jgi:hypothetical protein
VKRIWRWQRKVVMKKKLKRKNLKRNKISLEEFLGLENKKSRKKK